MHRSANSVGRAGGAQPYPATGRVVPELIHGVRFYIPEIAPFHGCRPRFPWDRPAMAGEDADYSVVVGQPVEITPPGGVPPHLVVPDDLLLQRKTGEDVRPQVDSPAAGDVIPVVVEENTRRTYDPEALLDYLALQPHVFELC